MASSMATSAERPFPANHPLEGDEARLNHILDLMWARIHKTMFKGHAVRSRRRSGPELSLVTGTTARQVLHDALTGLLYFDPARLETSWEALAVSIAHNKAVQAIRDATKGRTRDSEDETSVLSLDVPDEHGNTLAEKLADPLADPEAEAIALAQELAYRRIAEQILTPRDRDIYFRTHHRGESRVALADEFNLTPQRVGQIYTKAAKGVHVASRRDPAFLRVSETTEGGPDDE
jgi:DNA-directed RNA polymerase specialized sigma24 family protein